MRLLSNSAVPCEKGFLSLPARWYTRGLSIRKRHSLISCTTGSRSRLCLKKNWDTVVSCYNDETQGHDFRHDDRTKTPCGRQNYFKTQCLNTKNNCLKLKVAYYSFDELQKPNFQIFWNTFQNILSLFVYCCLRSYTILFKTSTT